MRLKVNGETKKIHIYIKGGVFMKCINIILIKDKEIEFEKMQEEKKKEVSDRIKKQAMKSIGYQKL